MKLYVNFINLCFLGVHLGGFAMTGVSQATLNDVSPNTIEFAWDVHDVIIRPNVLGMVSTGLSQGGVKAIKLCALLGYDCATYCWNRKPGQTLQLAQDMYTLLKRKPGATGEEYKAFLQEYDPTLWPIAEQLAVEQSFIPGTREIIQDLNNLGYTQRIASNIGSLEYNLLSTRHNFFDNNLCEGVTVNFSESPQIRKPSKEFFERYQARYNAAKRKTIIFIDDNPRNVESARQSGMIGIVFKKAEKLRQDLQMLGIPLPNN